MRFHCSEIKKEAFTINFLNCRSFFSFFALAFIVVSGGLGTHQLPVRRIWWIALRLWLGSCRQGGTFRKVKAGKSDPGEVVSVNPVYMNAGTPSPVVRTLLLVSNFVQCWLMSPRACLRLSCFSSDELSCANFKLCFLVNFLAQEFLVGS
jgi:hypothetical protein